MRDSHDPWLLPTRQADHPTRRVLPSALLHARREGTFLVLAAIVLVAATALVLLGTGRIVDLDQVLASVLAEVELPVAMSLPIGVLAFPPGVLAVMLVCELYGRRRSIALVVVGSSAAVGLVGLVRVARPDLDGAVGPGLALASCYLIAQLSNTLIFDALRRRMRDRQLWLRANVATLLAQLGGWAAFAFVLHGTSDTISDQAIGSLAAGGFAFTSACVLLGTLPLVRSESVV